MTSSPIHRVCGRPILGHLARVIETPQGACVLWDCPLTGIEKARVAGLTAIRDAYTANA